MRPLKNQLVPIERLTREPLHHFYGYYDNQPFSFDLEYHLVHRVPFMNRMQTVSDVAELGMIRLRDNAYLPMSETSAWNFQQGSMYQWRPAHPEEVLYNVCYAGEYKSVVQNVRTGVKRILPRPIASVSADGRTAVSINFSRVYWFRPGYGYDGLSDPWVNELHPADDGVYRMDLDTGDCELILALDDMYRIALPFMTSDEERDSWKFLVNHINLNPSGTRFLALFRGRADRPRSPWRTYTITANLSGTEPYLLLDDVASHLHWRDDGHVMIYARTYRDHDWGCWLFRDRSHEAFRYDPRGTMPGDGHCSFSPDRRWILNDTYPRDGYRSLYLYDITKTRTILLADIATIPMSELTNPDMRCDLHPRWSPDGSMISFDSVHEGHRHVYRIRMEDLPEKFR
ncbi:MAG: hypothetical protein VB111_04640 [Clostridiaceae bacterium]|nr:hypothetical protein [Clostridiaceae bacterium]